ncbi:MAG TPA: hypothetical protein VFF80_05045, partial [Bacillota bacterium]|nr:hypothetical protein [Bacillota bacterium]
MKKLRRLIAIILTLSFCVSVFPLQASAAANEKLLYHKQIIQVSNTGVETATNVVVRVLLTPENLPSSQIQFEELITPEADRIETDVYG